MNGCAASLVFTSTNQPQSIYRTMTKRAPRNLPKRPDRPSVGGVAAALKDDMNSVGKVAIEAIGVQQIVNKQVIKYVPFVCSDEEMAYGAPFSKITLSFLAIGREDQEGEKTKKMIKKEQRAFWEKHKTKAYRCLCNKRSNMSNQVGNKFKGNFTYQTITERYYVCCNNCS